MNKYKVLLGLLAKAIDKLDGLAEGKTSEVFAGAAVVKAIVRDDTDTQEFLKDLTNAELEEVSSKCIKELSLRSNRVRINITE